MTEMGVSGAASDLRAAHSVAQILFFHHSGALDRLCKGGPAAAALVLIRGGKERLAGDDIHIDALFKLVPELACEGALRAALLRDAVLLRRQLVPDGLRRGLLVVTRVDAQPGKELHLRARDVAVAVRILFEVVLVVFLGGIEVFERADLHEEFFAAAALDLRDALHRLSLAFVGEVNAGLVLAAAVVALPVLHRGVDDIEVGQQQRTAGAFLNLGSAHIGGERLVDELLQRLRLLLFRDGAYDGFTHDIAAAVDHIGGGISKDVGSKLSRLTI